MHCIVGQTDPDVPKALRFFENVWNYLLNYTM